MALLTPDEDSSGREKSSEKPVEPNFGNIGVYPCILMSDLVSVPKCSLVRFPWFLWVGCRHEKSSKSRILASKPNMDFSSCEELSLGILKEKPTKRDLSDPGNQLELPHHRIIAL